MAIDPIKLEERIDRTVAANTDIKMELGGVQFKTMVELMEFAKMMAVSDCAVPPHLRLNPGACLAICTKALRFGFDPFALAEHSFAMDKDVEVTVESANGGRSTHSEKVKIIAYDSFVIAAIINAHAPITGRMRISYSGEGAERKCKVTAISAGETLEHESPAIGERIKAIGTSQKGNLKGSPLWITKPDQQLAYDTRRDFCRKHFPEILLGWYDKDEFDENVRAERAQDVTPATGLSSRLKGGKGKRGFDAGNVAALEHKPGETVPEKSAAVSATVATVAAPESGSSSTGPAPALLQQEPEMALSADLVAEVQNKPRALANCKTEEDVRGLVDGVTELLRGHNRNDLLPEFLDAAKRATDRLTK